MMMGHRFGGLLFAAVGLAMVVWAISIAANVYQFSSHAVETTGTVLRVEEAYVSTDDGDELRFTPTIEFWLGQEAYVFKGSYSKRHNTFRVGQQIQVFYHSEDPANARTNMGAVYWASPIVLGIFGLVFSGFGVSPWFLSFRHERKVQDLRLRGMKIRANFERVEQNTNIRINRQYPYRLVATWRDPKTGELVLLKSHNIWQDPTLKVRDDTITILMDLNNPKRYVFDVDF